MPDPLLPESARAPSKLPQTDPTAIPKTRINKEIALRLRQLLSGHIKTLVVLIDDSVPNKTWKEGSKRRIIRFRLEPYVGQLKYGTVTQKDREEFRIARQSGLVIKMDYETNGFARIEINRMPITSWDGWYITRLRKMLNAFVEEMTGVIFDPDVPVGPNTKFQLLAHNEDGTHSYVRMRGLHPSTQAISRRGESGRIHISEPVSARRSAYPGW